MLVWKLRCFASSEIRRAPSRCLDVAGRIQSVQGEIAWPELDWHDPQMEA